MLKEEFEALKGIVVSSSTYAEIEKLYADSSLDKQSFCESFTYDQIAGATRRADLANNAEVYHLKLRIEQLEREKAEMRACLRNSNDLLKALVKDCNRRFEALGNTAESLALLAGYRVANPSFTSILRHFVRT